MLKPNDLKSTYKFLRECISPWKMDSKKAYNGKCSLTGTKDTVQVHHLNKSFIEITEETFLELNLQYYNSITEYTQEELNSIKAKCLELHYKYGLGTTICDRMHKAFHKQYGVTGYTAEDFKTFSKHYKSKVRESRQALSRR